MAGDNAVGSAEAEHIWGRAHFFKSGRDKEMIVCVASWFDGREVGGVCQVWIGVVVVIIVIWRVVRDFGGVVQRVGWLSVQVSWLSDAKYPGLVTDLGDFGGVFEVLLLWFRSLLFSGPWKEAFGQWIQARGRGLQSFEFKAQSLHVDGDRFHSRESFCRDIGDGPICAHHCAQASQLETLKSLLRLGRDSFAPHFLHP